MEHYEESSFQDLVLKFKNQINQVEQKNSETSLDNKKIIDKQQFLRVNVNEFKKLLIYNKEIIIAKNETIMEQNSLIDFYLKQNKTR